MQVQMVDLKSQYELIKDRVNERILTVLSHGKFILGPESDELEFALASFSGCKKAFGVSSGTDALIIPLMAWGVGRGDAVFLPSFTFTATAEVVVLLGATPVFVDVSKDTFNIDMADLEAKISVVKKEGHLVPKVVIAVDLFGLPADYDRLRVITEKEDMHLMADAAQSFGASSGGKRVGALAPTTATSFFPAKPLGCYGDGGAVFVDSDEDNMENLIRSIRVHGQGKSKYDVVRIGINGRLDTIQAAILLEKLKILPDEIAAREKLASAYDDRLRDYVTLPPRVEGSQSAWAQYSILLKNRDAVMEGLKKKGIPTAVYYPVPMHMQPAYIHFGDGEHSLPVSEELSKTILSLPMHPYMDDVTAELICKSVIEVVTASA